MTGSRDVNDEEQPDEVFLREPIWHLELNDYQRINLLFALEEGVNDPGDWYGEIKLMLEKRHEFERVHWR